LLEVAKTLTSLSRIAQEESARDFFDKVLHESGFLTYVLGRPDALTVLNSVRGLANTLESLSGTRDLYTGAHFVADIQLYQEYGIEIDPDTQPKERKNAIHLVNAHRSKGLEYSHVYIIHVRDGHWGNKTKRNMLPLSTLAATSSSDIEDERRLFYVALTRAKLYLSVSYGITSQTRSKESTISQFMLEIDRSLIQECPTTEFEDAYKPESFFISKTGEVGALTDHAFIVDAFLEQGISATALNNFLDCPWKYFYRNLVRVPEKPTPSSLYGNALHNALRLFREVSYSTREVQPLSLLLEYLETSINQQGFTPTSYKDAQVKGVKALTQWYAENPDVHTYPAVCEKKYEVYMSLPTAPERVLLRGMIDVIEYKGDGSIHVVDYKTGKHRSRDEIEGKTKNGTGDYKRQLDFYSILLELSESDKPTESRLEFIEPNENGKTRKESFAYDGDAVAELKKQIAAVAEQIYTLSFWEQRCDTAECEYCALRFDSHS
jgi:DNA helicase-2/ATP-dependent DNA helicase PcrA